MAWIDCKKAYWLCATQLDFKLYKVHSKICRLIQNVMQYWKVSLYCADKQSIYQGDSLSPLLALMPLSGVLSNTDKGFQLCFGKKMDWSWATCYILMTLNYLQSQGLN